MTSQWSKKRKEQDVYEEMRQQVYCEGACCSANHNHSKCPRSSDQSSAQPASPPSEAPPTNSPHTSDSGGFNSFGGVNTFEVNYSHDDSDVEIDNDNLAVSGPPSLVGDSDIESDTYISDSDSDALADEDIDDLRTELKYWAKRNLSTRRIAINELLAILRKPNRFPSLPKDARTLLGNRKVDGMTEKAGGNYVYLGVVDFLQSLIISDEKLQQEDHVDLQLSFDGLPLYKSSPGQLWPILGRVLNANKSKKVGTFGIFRGDKKPNDPEEYLSDLKQELIDLKDPGVVIPRVDKKWPVKVHNIICDAPAKSFVKGTVGHNAFHGCDHCTTVGRKLNHRTCFPNSNAPPRTDESFDSYQDPDHHNCQNPWHGCDMKMVKQFPLDYMHLICLGCMKKLVMLWLKGRIAFVRLSAKIVDQIDCHIKICAPFIPSEYNRKCRSLSHVSRYKATEWLLNLTKVFVVTLKGKIETEVYQHFLLLSCAVIILRDPNFCKHPHLVNQAEGMLERFVEQFPDIYGEEYISYNVHNLLHLADCVREYGPLDDFSAFIYENHIGKFKRAVKKPNCELPQVVNWVHDQDELPESAPSPSTIFKKNHHDGPIPRELSQCDQYGFMDREDYCIRTRTPDNCFLCGSKVIVVENILHDKDKKETYLVYKKFLRKEQFFDYPCDSTHLGIWKVHHLDDTLSYCKIDRIFCKFALLPYKADQGVYVCFPMQHTVRV